MSVRHCIADIQEHSQKTPAFTRIRLPFVVIAVVVRDNVTQGLASQKTHGVERLFVSRSLSEFIHRHNVGMFELAGDPCFAEEVPLGSKVRNVVRTYRFQSYIAVEIGIASEPNSSPRSLTMNANPFVARSVGLGFACLGWSVLGNGV